MKKMQIAVVALVLALGFSAAYAATTPMPYPMTMAEFNAVYAYTNPAAVASCVTNTDIVLGKTNITIQTMTSNDTLYAVRMTTIPSSYTYAGVVAPVDLNKMFEESNIYTVTVIKTNDNWQYLAVYNWTTNTTEAFTNALGTVIPATTTTYRNVTQVWTNLWDAGSVTSTYAVMSMYVTAPYANGNDLIGLGANMSNQVTTLTNALKVGLQDANLRVTNYTTAAVGVLANNMTNQVTSLTNAIVAGLADANNRITNYTASASVAKSAYSIYANLATNLVAGSGISRNVTNQSYDTRWTNVTTYVNGIATVFEVIP